MQVTDATRPTGARAVEPGYWEGWSPFHRVVGHLAR
jgi:hypothetical protein